MIFIKAPIAGGVKTRLGAEIGKTAALRVYRELVSQTIVTVDGMPSTCEVEWWCYPPRRRPLFRKWLGARRLYICQKGKDLGARMERAFSRAFRQGAKRVVVIGTDCPRLSASMIRRAFHALDRSGAVVGPARDGGYYLLGLRRMVPAVFRQMPWGTQAVLSLTVQRLRAAGHPPARLAVRGDVDTWRDVQRYPRLKKLAA